MIHTFYNFAEDKFISVDDNSPRLNEILAKARELAGKPCIEIIHEGEIHVKKT